MSQDWLEQPERGSVLAIRAMVGLGLFVGRRIARLTLIPFVLHFLLFGRKARAASRQYLQRVLFQPVGFRQLFRG